jgi:hypothetical protein
VESNTHQFASPHTTSFRQTPRKTTLEYVLHYLRDPFGFYSVLIALTLYPNDVEYGVTDQKTAEELVTAYKGKHMYSVSVAQKVLGRQHLMLSVLRVES